MNDLERALLTTLFEGAPGGMCVLRGHELTIELANSTFLTAWKMTGSVIGQPLLVAFPELAEPRFCELLRGVMRTGIAVRSDETLVRSARGGTGVQHVRYFDLHCAPMRGADGTIDGVVVHGYDVTERIAARLRLAELHELEEKTRSDAAHAKRLEDALSTELAERADAARFRLLVESVKDYAIFILDPEGRIATWNAGAERIKGYTAQEIIGKHFSVFYPPEDVAAGKCERELEGAAHVGRFEDEGWRVRKDGTRLWANVVITALRDPSGKLVGFAKVTRDLTERRAAEEEARRFRLLVESVKDYAIFILDPEGRIATWNAGAERIKGYTAQEIIGKHFSVFYPPEDVAAGKCERELEGAAHVGRFEDEGWRVRKDGTRLWANVVITALRDPSGKLVGFAKVTRDLTERKAAEETVRRLAVEKAELAEKARVQEFQERFIAILGHDLRNPLAAIDMGAGVLRHRAVAANDAATTGVLDRMKSSSRRMTRMIEQILDLTRSRLAGGLEVKPAPMDMCDALTKIVDESRAAHPSRAIELRCPPLRGTWDQDRLEQVFSNLVSNAIHYGDAERPVTVQAREEGGSALVEVHNDGPPIAEELRAKIFNPFRRGERESRKKQTAGIGLGLFISREIVVAHGGEIEVRSTAKEGTTFRVTLPRR